MDSYDRRTARALSNALTPEEPRSFEAGMAIDMEMAKVYADAWSDLLIGKLAPKFLPPAQLGQALRDEWLNLMGSEMRSLQWRSSKWMKPAEWAAQMTAVSPEYDSFHAGKVGGWLSGFSGVEVQPAREYSVCIYLRGNPNELSQIAGQARRTIYASEVDWQEDGTLRLWWS